MKTSSIWSRGELEEGNITKPGIQLVLMNTGYMEAVFYALVVKIKTEVLGK